RGGIAPDEKQSNGKRGSNHSDIDPGTIFRTASGGKIDIFRAFDSFRSELKGPSDDERDRESSRDQYDHQPHDPSWNLQERENLGGNLNQEPADNRIGDRNFINIASLQLGEEILDLHSGFSSQSFWKRGSFRSGSNIGSSRSSAGVSGTL